MTCRPFQDSIHYPNTRLKLNSVTYKKKSSGFTLIEVLIASVILFSALAITAELYSASSLSAQKASEKAHFYQTNPVAITVIKTEIRQLSENRTLAELSSEFAIGGIHYQWQAQRLAFEPRAPDYDDTTSPNPQFSLFQVNVIVQNKDTDKTEQFQFRVAAW
jgi:prepilin-type N-terminal cleavage/methylation domain-containing protein